MIDVQEVSHHLRWEHNIRIRSALTCSMREMSKVWSDDMRYLKPLLRETAEAYCVFCGVIPHSNASLIKARQANRSKKGFSFISEQCWKGQK